MQDIKATGVRINAVRFALSDYGGFNLKDFVMDVKSLKSCSQVPSSESGHFTRRKRRQVMLDNWRSLGGLESSNPIKKPLGAFKAFCVWGRAVHPACPRHGG